MILNISPFGVEMRNNSNNGRTSSTVSSRKLQLAAHQIGTSIIGWRRLQIAQIRHRLHVKRHLDSAEVTERTPRILRFRHPPTALCSHRIPIAVGLLDTRLLKLVMNNLSFPPPRPRCMATVLRVILLTMVLISTQKRSTRIIQSPIVCPPLDEAHRWERGDLIILTHRRTPTCAVTQPSHLFILRRLVHSRRRHLPVLDHHCRAPRVVM